MCVCVVSLWSSALHRRGFDHRQRLETDRLHTERVLLHGFQDGRPQLRDKRTMKDVKFLQFILDVKRPLTCLQR